MFHFKKIILIFTARIEKSFNEFLFDTVVSALACNEKAFPYTLLGTPYAFFFNTMPFLRFQPSTAHDIMRAKVSDHK
jgi:hypothetical protein